MKYVLNNFIYLKHLKDEDRIIFNGELYNIYGENFNIIYENIDKFKNGIDLYDKLYIKNADLFRKLVDIGLLNIINKELDIVDKWEISIINLTNIDLQFIKDFTKNKRSSLLVLYIDGISLIKLRETLNSCIKKHSKIIVVFIYNNSYLISPTLNQSISLDSFFDQLHTIIFQHFSWNKNVKINDSLLNIFVEQIIINTLENKLYEYNSDFIVLKNNASIYKEKFDTNYSYWRKLTNG